MSDLLTTLQTRATAEANRAEVQLIPVASQQPQRSVFTIKSPEDVLQALKSKPDHVTLSKALRWLNRTVTHNDEFNVRRPSPKAAQIIFTLVNDIVPDYWETLESEGGQETNLLLQCLRSVAGIGAITSRLRLLLSMLKDSQKPAQVTFVNKTQPVEILLNVLETALAREDFVTIIRRDIEDCNIPSSQKSLQWKEFSSLVASGKVLSVASEANLALGDLSSSIRDRSSIGDGSQYAAWLGRCIQHTLKVVNDDIEGQRALSQLLRKGLTLGYTDQLLQATFFDLNSGGIGSLEASKSLIARLSVHEQRTFLYSVIRILSKQHLRTEVSSQNVKGDGQKKAIGGVASLLRAIVGDVPSLQDNLVEWLVGVSADAVGQANSAHRAVIVALSSIPEQVNKALQKGLNLFGDKLYIKHTPILHQEVNAQVLLMLAGYSFRGDEEYLMNLSRSSIYLNAVSNRLAASSQRARFLGMVVGTAFSELADPKDKRMAFSTDEMNSSDGQWYRSLTRVNDPLGLIEDLKSASAPLAESSVKPSRSIKSNISGSSKKTAQPSSKIISIEEIDDSSESETEDLLMYEKPDSDPEDEDEDPTLVQRNRPTAPVYIRDLIAGLRDDENFDRHKLALSSASSLIRRKAAFGTEVSENVEELASILVGLGDKWEMTDFQQMRLQGMIAVLIAEPLKMGQWFSRTFYDGDYSMGQRASVLTVLGLGARELAGLGKEDAALTGAPATTEGSFPSKRLPDKLHKIYALEAAPMNALTSQLEKTMIQPMAAEAADRFTGPNALKVRTFSSRMAVEKKRQKPIPNALAKIVADGFFFPLTGRWRIHLQSHGSTTSHTSPFLLSHLLKTLSLLLHASGPSTLSLPQMTSEYWALLLSLRSQAYDNDPSVLEALLFSLLTLLDVNDNDNDGGRRLAEQHARELLETREWVDGVLERVGGGSEEGERVRMLAAGVLVRCSGVVERYQRVLMGDLVDYM